MSGYAQNCPDCHPRAWCEYHRMMARREQVRSRIRRGLLKLRRCWRCLLVHPVGERYCRLTAEWNGYPWRETETPYTYPEAM